MIVDVRDLCVLNESKKLKLDLYVISCYRDNTFIGCFCYTTEDEAKSVYDNLTHLSLDVRIFYYLNKYHLNKYHLNKSYIDSNRKYFLNA